MNKWSGACIELKREGKDRRGDFMKGGGGGGGWKVMGEEEQTKSVYKAQTENK